MDRGTLIVVCVAAVAVIAILVIYHVLDEGDVHEHRAPSSQRSRTAVLKASKNSWLAGIYKHDAMLYGVKITPAQVLQESFETAPAVEKLALLLQDKYGPEKVVFAVENDQGDLSWQFIFHGMNRHAESQRVSDLFKGSDFIKPREVGPTSRMSSYSFKVMKDGKQGPFELDFIAGQDDDLKLPCEVVRRSEDGVELGRYILWSPNCSGNFEVARSAAKVGLSELDAWTLQNVVNDMKPDFIKVLNSRDEMSMHLIGLSANQFLAFLKSNDYPDFITSYVEANLLDLDNFKHEVEFDFAKGGVRPLRTRFYGMF